jgi:hypothetical protein
MQYCSPIPGLDIAAILSVCRPQFKTQKVLVFTRLNLEIKSEAISTAPSDASSLKWISAGSALNKDHLRIRSVAPKRPGLR